MYIESPLVVDHTKEEWTEVIEPRRNFFDLRLKELWRFRDLVAMLVRRDFVATYKQTILGPIWFFLQPLLTTITFFFLFSKAAKLPTDELPPILFYLTGITVWSYFSETLNKTATVFKDNAQLLGKVYFPRLALPISIVISNLVRFGIQFLLLLAVLVYYVIQNENVHPNYLIILTPVLLLLMGLLALGLGMIISAMTTKYRDIIFLLTFGIQLLMFFTPVILPLSFFPEKYKWILLANPMTAIVETFRFAFTGVGEFNWMYLGYSAAITLLLLVVGVVIFNRVEKNFTDNI